MFGKERSSHEPINNINGETDPDQMAEQLNDFFSTIANKLSAEFPQTISTHTEKICNQPKFTFKHISNLSLATVVGVDGISPRILKSAIKPLSILLSKLINKCLDRGLFPDALKIARISPIFKAGDRTDPSNY